MWILGYRSWMTTYLGKSCFIRFTASAFRKLRSVYVFSYFPFGFEGRMWDLIVSFPDYCLSFYFSFGWYVCYDMHFSLCFNLNVQMAFFLVSFLSVFWFFLFPFFLLLLRRCIVVVFCLFVFCFLFFFFFFFFCFCFFCFVLFCLFVFLI